MGHFLFSVYVRRRLKQNARKQGGIDFNNGSLMRLCCRGIGVGFGWGPVQITCLGVKRNEFSTRLFATTAKMLLLAPVVHLAIIQACFGLSSRVLLVSYLRRSNRKCTVKRFFKSTVMLFRTCARGLIRFFWRGNHIRSDARI